MVKRILVATDRSDTATQAVEWAAEMSDKYAADLLVLQVVAPEHLTAQEGGNATQAAADDLATFTRKVGGGRGRPLLVYDSDPADAIVRLCEQERVDLVVVGNVGMRDRTEFLLGSVSNQVSHNARCSVVIVNTALSDAPDGTAPRKAAQADAEPSEGQLLGRAAHVTLMSLAVVVLERRIRKALRSPAGPDRRTGPGEIASGMDRQPSRPEAS
jgi:ubiquinone biosynthesis protein